MNGYDAVLVDEAQDFHPDWWFPVQLLLKDPDRGRLTIFSDPEQAGIYGRGDSFPAGLLLYELLENCRNTKRIVSFCGNVIQREIAPFSFSPEGVSPEIHKPVPDASHRALAIQHLLGNLLDQGFAPSRIAVLSPWRSTASESALSRLFNVRGIPLRGDDDALPLWINGRVIWCSTIKSFKGVEADCVIIADVPSPNETPGFTFSDFYVAASRTKHRLWIFPCDEAARARVVGWL